MLKTEHADEPQFEALHARCKAAGIALMRSENWERQPIYMVERWGMYRELPTLLAVENWLEWTGQGRAQAS